MTLCPKWEYHEQCRSCAAHDHLEGKPSLMESSLADDKEMSGRGCRIH